MSSSSNYSITLLPTISLYLNRYGTIILYLISNLGNLSSIFIFSKKSWRKNVCSFYFIVCLVCCFIFSNTSILFSIITNNFITNGLNSSNTLCKIFFYVTYLFSVYYPSILILASIDRLLISSQNVDTRLYSSKRLAYLSLAASLLLWSLFLMHVLIKAGVQEVYPGVFVCYYEMSDFYMDFYSYSAMVMSLCIPLIMIVLSILAFKNVRRIRAVPRQQRRQVRSMTKKDFQLLRCLYIHNIFYVICSSVIVFSIAYNRILKFQAYSPITQAIDSFLTDLGTFNHYIPYCCSFFIFVSVSKAFRQELKRYAYKVYGKDSMTVPRGEEEINHGEDGTKETVVVRNVAVSTIGLRE